MAREAYAANYFDSYLFLVRIDGFVRAAFSKCEGLDGSADVITYAEGGNLVDDQSPGKVKFGNITLERGKTKNNDMYNWWKDVYDVTTGNGSASMTSLRKNIIIEQLDRSGAVKEKWAVYDAWPVSYKPGSFDASSNEKRIESLELANAGFEPIEV